MVIVVGAGLAGFSAALHLAERGVEVLLCEAHPEYLGGRTRARAPYSFEWKGERHTQSFDHGQHCIWTQYWNMRALLERLGIWAKHVRPCDTTRYLVDDGEQVHRLAPFDVDPQRVPPTLAHFIAHLAGSMRVPGWSTLDTLRLATALPRLLVTSTFRHSDHYDDWDVLSVQEMFAWIGLPEQMDQLFKSMCKASTFHSHAEISASWGLSMMESTMIAHPADHKMWCFRGNLGASLMDPLAEALRARGGRILRNARAVDVERIGDRITAVVLEPTAAAGPEAHAEVLTERRVVPCEAVVGATDIPGFQRWLLPTLADVDEVRVAANLEAVGSVSVRVVTERPVREDDAQMGIFSGRFRTLDTYFRLCRYQDEFAGFQARTGGEVIELHSYLGSRELAHSTKAAARALVEREVLRAWPELRGRIVHIEIGVNERTFDKQGVGHARFQPRMRTRLENLVLCGSWIKVDEAVHDMEKAVVTGLHAANALLDERGLPTHPVRPLRPRTPVQRAADLLFSALPRPPAIRPRDRDRRDDAA